MQGTSDSNSLTNIFHTSLCYLSVLKEAVSKTEDLSDDFV